MTLHKLGFMYWNRVLGREHEVIGFGSSRSVLFFQSANENNYPALQFNCATTAFPFRIFEDPRWWWVDECGQGFRRSPRYP